VSDVLLIIRREFRERVASRSFVVGTLVFPLLIIGLFVLPQLVQTGADWNLALVSEAPPGVGAIFTAALQKPGDAGDNRYHLTRVEGTLAEVRDTLNDRVRRKELDGYVVIPADVLTGGQLQFRGRKSASFSVLRDLRTAATASAQSERLKTAGIEPSAIARLVAPVQVDEARITEKGEERTGALSTFLAAYVVAFLIYLMTTLYGVAVMRSVLEEKTNRIAEVLMSTIRAPHLIAGKIIGVGSVAVLQVFIWVAITSTILSQLHRIRPGFGLPPAAMQALRVEPVTGVLLFLFFLLGFFLYAAVFATVGASVTTEQEAQSVQFIALTPMITPLMFLQSILNAPLGGAATVLGIIPFTAPITMPMRMASTPVPPLEIAVSLVLLVFTIAGVAWVAGKVYRVGMLSTGKKPTLGELVQWVRSA